MTRAEKKGNGALSRGAGQTGEVRGGFSRAFSDSEIPLLRFGG